MLLGFSTLKERIVKLLSALLVIFSEKFPPPEIAALGNCPLENWDRVVNKKLKEALGIHP